MNKKQVVLIAAIIAFIAGLVIISLIMNNGKTKDNGYNNYFMICIIAGLFFVLFYFL